jgi:hypothetical protein
VKGLFQEISKINLEDDGGFKFKAHQVNPDKFQEDRWIENILITYQNGQFTQEEIKSSKDQKSFGTSEKKEAKQSVSPKQRGKV